ncbi:NAD(P)-dependent oxidoreductase [Hoeflea sp. G2-23]|uniref:NAD(P)-dependent oxidoreductase n=1 Tax=Hoeflea algicola TaxID=2983763 RepID=A0ABT3Z9Q0_9HYPH|nr:NAD(P)-dependent oxidoreductase [Hoeflea algicola]MCY0148495.1 NAD(P)-dependent oxidoreductase [Hoeflea algicola]
MKVLVTGGAGFIGSAVARTLASRGDQVLAVDIGPPSRRLDAGLAASAKLEFATGDLTEWAQIAQLIKAFSPDAIVHCAAIVGVLNSVSAPFATMRVNVEGSLNLIEAMRLFDIRRMVHISTEEIYGPFDSDMINEDHPARPVKPYGISKYAVEQLARDYVRTYGLDIQHVRTCWVYGPGLPRPRVPKILIDAIIEKRSLHMNGGGDFRVDHIYVDDCVDGILKVLDHQDHRHDAYNIATGIAPSIGEIVATLKTLEPSADISIAEGDYEFTKGVSPVKKGALDISRARQELGYAPRFTLKAGLGAYLDWRRSNPV